MPTAATFSHKIVSKDTVQSTTSSPWFSDIR